MHTNSTHPVKEVGGATKPVVIRSMDNVQVTYV